MGNEFRRLTPEEALKLTKNDEKKRGTLKIFIGYAPGVGKTYSMLNEANRRKRRGEDIIIGYVEAHKRAETDAQIGTLEVTPTKRISYNNVEMEEMDTDAIIARHPETVLIDELAHNNVPGSKYNKRYQDIEEILQNGINVSSTLNIQHLESLNDVIKQITGIVVKETIPDYIIQNANEVVLLDITPEDLQNRLKRGSIYDLDKVDQALSNFFRKGNLTALREIALRQTADEVDEELEEYLTEHGIKDSWQTVERLMICITPSIRAKKLIRRGARMAKRYKCEWIVVCVNCTHFFAKKLTEKEFASVEGHKKLAIQLGAEFVTLTGKSVSSELSKFASERHITQILLGHSSRTKLEILLRGSTVEKLLKKLKNIEIHVIPSN